MKKTILSVMMLFACIMGAVAQQGMTPLPLQQDIKTGVLPNGLTYYVLHNEEPKERANFYIAQKVGSTLETPEQLGLAHFLEHMAFNGTTHYPGKNMLNYLQNKGIRFGADINAYTYFDETVYNINNVPTTDAALMDSVLLVIRDWCDGILLEESEIEAERGVIQEEWRQRNDANQRMHESVLPQIYKEYQYQQVPIGKMDVVMNFHPDVLRAYYKKWYRPDQQGIVVVGDFDADEMEKKVIALFSTVVMPEDAAPRTYPQISDNVEPIYATFEDAELTNPMVTVSFKYDKTPVEMRNTLEAYVQDCLIENVISQIVNQRLNEYSENPECPYAMAGMSFGNLMVPNSKGAINFYIIPKADSKSAMVGAMEVAARAFKAGVTQTEVDRAVTELQASYEKMFNERNKRNSDSFGKEIYRHFIDNEPMPGIEVENQLVQQLLPSIPAEAYNQMMAGLLTAENQVVVVTQPKAEGYVLPAREDMIPALENTLNAQYEAYVDEVITDPLIAKMPKPGKIKKQQSGEYGTTVFTLSNGVRVVVKPTDFADDQILMTMFREGGKTASTSDQVNEIRMLDDAVSVSKHGQFDQNKLRKYLAGKHAALGLTVNSWTDTFEGMATVKDLPTLFELLYSTFTDLNADEVGYKAMVEKYSPMLANRDKDPMTIYGDRRTKAQLPDFPAARDIDLAAFQAADYGKMLKMVKDMTANAADYTMILVGNVDINTLKPLLEQYVASLPSKGKPSKVKRTSDMKVQGGQITDEWNQPMQAPSVMVYDNYSGDMPYTVANDVMLSLTGDILGMIYTETLREEEGGTYGAGVAGYINPNNNQYQLLYTFQTNADQKQSLIDRAEKEMMNLLNNGATEDHFNKTRLAAIKQLEIQERQNNFWLNTLLGLERGTDSYKGRREFLDQLTIDQQNAFMRNLTDGKNRIQVIMNGVEAQ